MKKNANNILKKIFIWLPVLFIPVVFTTNTIDANVLIRFISLSVYLLALTLFLFYNYKKQKIKKQNIIWNRFFQVFLLYTLISCISLFVLNVSFGDGLFEWMKIILLGMLILLLSIIYADFKEFISEVSKSMTVLGLIISIYGIYQFYTISIHSSVSHNLLYQMNSTFAHKNIFAEALLICLPFSLFSFFTLKKYWRIAGITSGLLILSLIIVTLCRAIWVALIVAGITGLFIALISSGNLIKFISQTLFSKKIVLTLILFILIAFSAIYIYSQFDTLTTFKKQIKSLVYFNYGSTKDRIELWKKTYTLFKEKPLFGYGMGSYKVEILKFGNKGLVSEDNLTFYQRPHNDFLWILSEQGVFSLILYLLLFFFGLKYIFKILKNTNEQSEKIFFILMSFALTGYLVFSFFSFPKERIEHSVFLGFIFSSIIIYYNKYSINISKNNRLQLLNLLTLISAFFCIFSIIIGSIKLNSEIHIRKAFEYRSNNNWNGEIKEIDQANSFFYSTDPVSTPIRWYRGMANFNLNKTEESFYDFKEAYRVSPYHVYVLNDLATCYEYLGNHHNSMELCRTALMLSPTYEDAALNLCALKFNAGDIDTAYTVLHNFNTKIKDSLKYNQFLRVVLKAKFNKLMENENDELLKKYFKNIQNMPAWSYDIHIKSQKNKISLEKQALLDIVYSIEYLDKNPELANNYRIKFKLKK